jgi:hypothetical protein
MAFCSACSCNNGGFVHFQRSKQVKIWWCEVRTVWWVYQNYSSKFSDGCGGVHIVVSWHCLGGATLQVFFLLEKLEKGRHWDFLAESHCCLLRQSVHKNTCLITAYSRYD